MLWNGNPKPDEREEGIRQPVLPRQVAKGLVSNAKVHPHIEKLVEADTGHVVGFESLRLECLSRDVVVAFERGNCPTALSFGDQFFGTSVNDLHSLAAVK